jgi:predicted  nucleic acid-binding Zn-ribbon protein
MSTPRSSHADIRLQLRRTALAVVTGAAGLTFATAAPEPSSPASMISMDRLTFVDCLLPGQTRRLGGHMQYLGPRHAVRTTVDDCEIRGGEYVAYDRANYATALKVWLPEAERGEEQAQIYVGEIYEKGLGTDPDYARAAEWYEKAVQRKSKQGMSHLAYLYEQGLGVAKDPVRALNLYRSAAGITTDDLTFQSEVTTANSKIAELTTQLEERTNALADLNDHLEKTRAELETLQGAAVQSRRAQDQLRSKLKQLESQPAATADTHELDTVRSQLQQREQEVKEQSVKIAELEQSSSQQNSALMQRLAEIERDDSALKTQLGSAREQAASLRSQLAAAQARETALEQDSTKLKEAAEKSERAVQKAQTDLRNRPPDPKVADNSGLNTALAAAQIDLQRQRTVIQNLDAERGKLADDVKQLKTALQGAADREKHAAVDAATARAQLASLQAELLERSRRVDTLSATIQADESQIARDRAQLSQSAARLGAQDAEVQRLNKVLVERETTLSRDKAEREGLAAAVKAYKTQISQAQISAQRGPPAPPRPPPPPIPASELGMGTSYALVIADSRYEDAKNYPPLPSVEKDAVDIKNALQRYGFKDVPLPPNPSGKEMENAIAKLLGQLAGTNDSVLIYYAGHGTVAESNNGATIESTTYWIPKDADPNNRASWVSAGWITDMIRGTKARHVLVVADSCYAGAMVHSTNVKIVSTRSAADPERIKLLAQLASRTVLTSGGNEPVLSNGPGGNSIFARAFIDILNRNTGVLDGSALYDTLAAGMQQALANLTRDSGERAAQHPRYAKLADAGHLEGDFLFVPPTLAVASLK